MNKRDLLKRLDRYDDDQMFLFSDGDGWSNLEVVDRDDGSVFFMADRNCSPFESDNGGPMEDPVPPAMDESIMIPIVRQRKKESLLVESAVVLDNKGELPGVLAKAVSHMFTKSTMMITPNKTQQSRTKQIKINA